MELRPRPSYDMRSHLAPPPTSPRDWHDERAPSPLITEVASPTTKELLGDEWRKRTVMKERARESRPPFGTEYVESDSDTSLSDMSDV